jgi:hypothetical protein
MRRALVALTVALGLVLAACGEVKPFTPPATDEIPPGPGLFTGKKGELVLTPPTPH